MRLFIAIHFSDEICAVLLDAAEQLRAASSGGNFTRPENLHLTLAFIGESNDLITIRRIMDRCAGEAFPLAVGGSGRFGDLYWAGIEENSALHALAERLRAGLHGAGFAIEDRPFKAHITLVRQLRAARPHRRQAHLPGGLRPRAALILSRYPGTPGTGSVACPRCFCRTQ